MIPTINIFVSHIKKLKTGFFIAMDSLDTACNVTGGCDRNSSG